MKRALVIAIVLCAARGARADDHRIEATASFLAASENSSPKSAGYPGAELEVARWFGPLAVVGEAGAHTFDWDGDARWLGGAARLALVFGHGRGGVANGRLWIESGVAVEAWHLNMPGVDAHYTRGRMHLGVGADLESIGPYVAGLSLWFRVERGPQPNLMAAAPSDAQDLTPPGATVLVFGIGFVFGHT